MKYLDEFRDAEAVRRLAAEIHLATTKPWTLMEVCGGQTHSILRYGVDEVLPGKLELIHGPGCPVCVTAQEVLDQAIAIAGSPGVVFCSFGDMLRVPGTVKDLLAVKSEGGDVRIVYSPMDALAIARQHPSREVVFFAVGFETTAPANALAAREARRLGVTNFSLLASHVRVPPALEAILGSPHSRVQGFLAAGHVCTVMGTDEYHDLARRHRVPIVVTGFEPVDLLQGILAAVRQLESGRAEVEIAYSRSVRPEGNREARRIMDEVFEIADRPWRGLGTIPRSGLALRPAYAAHDAALRFGALPAPPARSTDCASGLVLQGLCRPPDCPAFGTRCTPENPLGATMVSNEGACAAYYRYRTSESP